MVSHGLQQKNSSNNRNNKNDRKNTTSCTENNESNELEPLLWLLRNPANSNNNTSNSVGESIMSWHQPFKSSKSIPKCNIAKLFVQNNECINNCQNESNNNSRNIEMANNDGVVQYLLNLNNNNVWNNLNNILGGFGNIMQEY